MKGLKYLLQHYKEWGITSLAVPPLGCGQGQLEWKIVGPTLYRFLNQLDIPVELYAPHGTPHEELRPEFLDQKEDIKPAVKLSFGVWSTLLTGVIHKKVGPSKC